MTSIPIPWSIARQYRQPEPDEISEQRRARIDVLTYLTANGIKFDSLRFLRWAYRTGRLNEIGAR